MTYQWVDPVLEQWAHHHGLRVCTSFKDEEVRSVEVVSPDARRFQIWLDPPGPGAHTTVHAWDFGERRASFKAGPGDLDVQLERAYAEVRSWYRVRAP